MNHSYKILNAKIERDHEGNSEYLKVDVQVYLGEEIVGDPRSYAFALDTEAAAIHAELNRVMASLDSDAEIAERSATEEARRQVAENTVNALLEAREE